MSTTTINANDIGRLSRVSAAVTNSDYLVLQRATTAHVRRVTVDELSSAFATIKTSGNATVGGALAVSSNATVTGSVTSADLYVTNTSAITSTAVTAISGNGMTQVGTTAVHNALVLSAPAAVGGFKYLRSTSTFAMTITASAATIGSTKTTIVFGGTDQAVTLRAETTTQWGVYATVPSTAGTTAIALIA